MQCATDLNMHELQDETDRLLMMHESRIAYGRENAELDLRWQHNEFYQFASRLQDEAAADYDSLAVRSPLTCSFSLEGASGARQGVPDRRCGCC
jgi:hypothetical protein